MNSSNRRGRASFIMSRAKICSHQSRKFCRRVSCTVILCKMFCSNCSRDKLVRISVTMSQVLPKGCRDDSNAKDLLVDNINTWGNIQYNIPLRVSTNETRTATDIALRHIPAVTQSTNCEIKEPIPDKLTSRDMVVEKESYKTTSGECCVKPNPNKAMERADCAINCKRVAFMTGVEKRLQGKNIIPISTLSEMKDRYRGASPSKSDVLITPPDPGYICNVVASGRNEAPSIPEDCGGYRKQMDPYLTTYRNYQRPFTTNEHFGIAAKDHITFYSEINLPKVRGFGPRYKEIWMPLTAKVHRAVYDRSHVKKEFKEVAASHNPVSYIKSAFESETKRKYKVPFAVSPLASWSPSEHFDSPPFAPNPYQTNAAPFMYCSDYCTIAQGTPTCIAVDQHKRLFPPHRHCKERYIVSKD